MSKAVKTRKRKTPEWNVFCANWSEVFIPLTPAKCRKANADVVAIVTRVWIMNGVMR